MTKTYCNKCGKELKNFKECRKVNLRIHGKITIGADWNLDYCEDCFKDVVGIDFYEQFRKREIEFQQKVEERERKRKKKNEM